MFQGPGEIQSEDYDFHKINGGVLCTLQLNPFQSAAPGAKYVNDDLKKKKRNSNSLFFCILFGIEVKL